jgi:hypothetical protein
MLFDETSRLVRALLGAGYYSSLDVKAAACTYWHFGRKAASVVAPEAPEEAPFHFPLKLASVMELSIEPIGS